MFSKKIFSAFVANEYLILINSLPAVNGNQVDSVDIMNVSVDNVY